MRIMDVVARWPGASHDEYIFDNSALQTRLAMGEFGDGLILGDCGYAVKPYMITPLRHPTLPEHHLYNEAQIRTRNTVERSYGVWKRRFPVLLLGLLPIRIALPTAQLVVVACAVLHNVAVDMNEEDPPIDPDLPPVDLDANFVPNEEEPEEAANAGVQRELVDYFRRLR
jgi:hypothetical protein